jgi:flagellar biosynthesis protein FliR
MTIEEFLSGSVFQFFLVFARLGAAISLMPGFGEAYVPLRVRLVFALFISLVLLPLVGPLLPTLPAQPAQLALLIVGETLIGLFFGFLGRLILFSAQSAGMVIALQTGIANALSTDPTTAQQGAITGNFFVATALVLIFASGLDHTSLKALVGTYGLFPAGGVPNLGDMADMAARLVAGSFTLAMQISAPFLVYGIVLAIGMGLLARLMPTLQVFFVVMPLQIMIGLALMAMTIGAAMTWLLQSYERELSMFLE